MDEGRVRSVFCDLFEVDDELGRVVFGVGEDLGAEEGYDVVGDDGDGFVGEVGVVDAEVGVEPGNFVGN